LKDVAKNHNLYFVYYVDNSVASLSYRIVYRPQQLWLLGPQWRK